MAVAAGRAVLWVAEEPLVAVATGEAEEASAETATAVEEEAASAVATVAVAASAVAAPAGTTAVARHATVQSHPISAPQR